MQKAEKSRSPITLLKPAGFIVPLNLREVWDYRDLVYFMLWRDIKGRYRQMALGPLWMILQPIANMVLYTLIFGVVADFPSDGVPYPLFNFSALLPWMLFSGAASATAFSLLTNRQVITKVYFPRLIVPISSAMGALFDFFISFLVLLGMMVGYGYYPDWTIFLVPVYLLLAVMTALAVGLWMASWIVHYHDVGTVMGFGLRAWMYCTPVVYPISMIPEAWQWAYKLNPMVSVIDGFRWSLLGAGSPPDSSLLISFLVVIPILITGAYHFRKAERNIVDIA